MITRIITFGSATQGSENDSDESSFEPTLTVFMLVTTDPKWLAFLVERRYELISGQLTPVLQKHVRRDNAVVR